MTLSDLIYIIDGKLEVSQLPADASDGESVFEAVLYDNIHDPCMLQGEGLGPEEDSEWRYATARASGRTREAALRALVNRIAGNVLGHDWPVMWRSYTEWLRVPPWLEVGTPETWTSPHTETNRQTTNAAAVPRVAP